MASWKKVIVSGSGAHLASVTASNLTDDRLVYSDNGGILLSSNVQINDGGHLVGQFSGSHEFALTDGNGIADFSYDGGTAAVVTVDTASLAGNGIAASSNQFTVQADSTSGGNIQPVNVSANGVGFDVASIDGTGLTATSGVLNVGGLTPSEFAAANVVTSTEVISNSTTGSDDTFATTKAIKDYVDNQLGGSDLDISDGTNTDSIDLDSETLTFTGGGGVTATVSSGTVTFGTTTSELGGGLISGSQQVVDALPSGTVSGSAQIRSEFSAVDTTGAAGIDMSYDSSNGQFSGSLVNSNITLGADTGADVAIDLGGNFDVVGGTNINTSINGDGDITVNLDAAPSGLAASGSFSGSFEGDGSGLTGIASTLNVNVKDTPSDSADAVSIDLLSDTLEIVGTANEVDASASGDVITIGLPQDVTVARDLTVTRDLTVLGDTTTLSTTNLLVEDAFILVASGSTGAVDGGIIVDGGDDNGEGVVYDTDAQTDGRWGFASGMGDTDNSVDLTAAGNAFVAAVIDMNENHTDAAKYQKAGNIKIDTNEDIYIYS